MRVSRLRADGIDCDVLNVIEQRKKATRAAEGDGSERHEEISSFDQADFTFQPSSSP